MPKKSKITIGENDIKQKDVVMVNVLMKQLNPETKTASLKDVKAVMKLGTIVTLRKNGILIGMGTLVPVRKLFAFCGNIEDLVVEEKERGRGLGKKILQTIIKKSKKLGMKFVNFTSNPKRKKANELYATVGFKPWKTNIYGRKN